MMSSLNDDDWKRVRSTLTPTFSTGKLKQVMYTHDDVIKWKHFTRNWPFVRGIHRSPVNSPHKGPWRGALIFSLICAWTNCWVNNRESGDLRRHRAQYNVTLMLFYFCNAMFQYIYIYIYTTGMKYEIPGKHNGNTRIGYLNLMEMTWHQLQTTIVTLMQLSRVVLLVEICNLQCTKLKIQNGIYRNVSFLILFRSHEGDKTVVRSPQRDFLYWQNKSAAWCWRQSTPGQIGNTKAILKSRQGISNH